MATLTVGAPATAAVESADASEWWQRWAARRAAWWAAHPVLARRLTRVRTALLWLGLVWVAIVLVVRPELRLGARAYLGCVWVAVAWFALARTKTLTWSGYMRWFAASVPWSVLVGVVCTVLARSTGLSVSAAGPTVAIAALGEECLKLAPLALLGVLAPRRVARFAAVDWLLLGIASGVAFTAVEEGVRRTALMTTTGLGALDRLLDQVSGQTVPSGWVEFRALPVPTGSLTHTSLLPGTVAYAGHAVLTGLVAGAVGLAVATWRAARGSRTFGARAARVGAFLLPPLVLWVAVADHAGMNAQSWAANLTPDVVPKWLDPAISTVPSWLRAPWSALGHGHGRIWLLLLVALACALVDAARLARMPAANLRLQAPPEWVTALGAASRSRRWVRPLRTVAGAGAALVWLTVRDLGQVVLAGARQPGASRLAAARTAMVAGSTLRALREAAFDHLAAPVRTRRQRLLAAGALTALLAVALLLAPAIADHVGRVPWEFPRWLAGLYDAMANWWHDQSFGTQLAIGAAIVALVVFSGGTFGLALGLSGAVTWTLDKGNGIATFIRDPEQATDNYFATATPLQVAADTVGFVATFLPMSFAGGLAGRATRNVIDELRFNAGAFFERRRAVFTTAPDAGAADYSKFRPGEPAHDLADQTHRASALSRRDGSLDSSAQSGQLDDGREARDTLDPMRAPASLAAEKISAGHAFDKHVLARGEFPGITSRAQFAAHIERVVREGEVRVLLRGRVAYWHDGTIVVRNPGAVDGGSAYRPKGGYEYFTETLE